MTSKKITATTLLAMLLIVPALAGQPTLKLDERPAGPEEWGYRPAEGTVSQVNPPSFSWRPQKGLTWEIECSRDTKFEKIEYRAENLEFNVHCPPRVFQPGTYAWRYRGKDGQGRYTNWSQPRTFTIAQDAVAMPLLPRQELISRIPRSHPRLFMRPENLDHLRELARSELSAEYRGLVQECEKILAKPPSTNEPPKYPAGMQQLSEEWREIWWGNRVYTINALNSAATLAFTRLLGGNQKYGQEAKRILLECAKWDPKGSTGYRYNDEAGMPYAYHFSRTYTFLNDVLTEDEKNICRAVMKVRGEEIYQHLCPRHLWQPYSSHSNRAWHKLGEVGIAFLNEIDGAEDWVWFAANVFFNVYPVWSDEDGGWHEGSSYWSSYISRFTWWADVMREAMGINAYNKPYFAKVGYYPMYLMPPGKNDGGFGDGAAPRTASENVPLMSELAAQAGNGHWQWYVQQMGGPKKTTGYIGFIRGTLPKVQPKPPDDLPTSRLFRGTGQAYLNTTLKDAKDDVQVIFKSSPFGTQSHGNEANNSFVLWAYGQRLLVRSGHYDLYGSDHHKNWVWSTRSVNNITVNKQGQGKCNARATGEIVAFKTTPAMDIVVGEAGQAYEPKLLRFTRAIIFVKPDLVVVYDRLQAKEPSTYEYWLHAVNKIAVQDQHNIGVQNADVACDINFLTPADLSFEQTDQYDPNPRERIKVREWHLTATTPAKSSRIEFVTLYRPHRIQQAVPPQASPPYVWRASLERIDGGYALQVKLSDGQFTALLPTDDRATLEAHGLQSKGAMKCTLERVGHPTQILEVRQGDLD